MKVVFVFLAATTLAAAQTVDPWTWKNPLPQGNDLELVSMLSDSSVLIGGRGGVLLHSSDDGGTWSTTVQPGGLRIIHDASFPGPLVGFLSGEDRFGAGAMAKTTDGGNTWAPLQTNTFASLLRVEFLTETVGFACGPGGTIIRTLDAGATWSTTQTGTFDDIYDLSFKDSLNGTAVAENGKMMETFDGGQSWSPVQFPAGYSFRSIRFAESTIGVAVGDSGLIMTRSPRPFAGWEKINLPTSESFHDIIWLDDVKAIAVGSNGTIAVTTDIGTSWDIRSTGLLSILRSVASRDTTFIMAVGEQGAIQVSSNEGLTWLAKDSGSMSVLHAVSSSPDGHAIAVGEEGIAWVRSAISGEWTSLPQQFAATMYSCLMISGTDGIAAGSGGRIYRTTDAGSSWSEITSGVATNLYATAHAGNTVMAVGASGTIIASTDGGMTWTPRTSGTTSTLRGIAFADADTVVAVGSGVTAIRSTDGGSTWTPVSVPISTSYISVAFSDPLNGLIGGAPLAAGHPPTILATSDGGTTWGIRQIAAPPSTDPFAFFTLNAIAYRSPSEVVAGSIEGTIFRSSNGGQSWSQVLTGTGQEVRSIVWSHDRWIAVGNRGMIMESPRDTTVAGVGRSVASAVPETPLLLNTYPNPFNPATTIEFVSRRSGRVQVRVYDIIGRHVADLFDGTVVALELSHISFDAADLPSGTYIIRITQGVNQTSARVLLLR